MNKKTPLSVVIEARGLKLNWVAEQLGYTRQTVSKWVNGVTVPERDKALEICRLFPELNVMQVIFPEGIPVDGR